MRMLSAGRLRQLRQQSGDQPSLPRRARPGGSATLESRISSGLVMTVAGVKAGAKNWTR